MTVVDEHIKALEDALFLNDSTELKRAVENTIGVFSGNIDGLMIIAAEMLRRSRLRCCGVPRCAATR